MKALLKELLYIHSLFSFLLYLAGNVIVIVALEYKLKNPNLKHTLAGFVSIALSGFAAYFIPIKFFGVHSPGAMQTLGIFAAFFVQAAFWALWFRKRFKEFAPILLIAFSITSVVALVMYFSFMAYIDMVVKGAIQSTGPLTRYLITNF